MRTPKQLYTGLCDEALPVDSKELKLLANSHASEPPWKRSSRPSEAFRRLAQAEILIEILWVWTIQLSYFQIPDPQPLLNFVVFKFIGIKLFILYSHD